MFGIGSTELLVILVVALLVLGPKNLPKVAQSLGKAMGEFRKYSTEFQRTLNTEIAFEEQNQKKAEAEQELVTTAPSATFVPEESKGQGSLEIPVPETNTSVASPTEVNGASSSAALENETAPAPSSPSREQA